MSHGEGADLAGQAPVDIAMVLLWVSIVIVSIINAYSDSTVAGQDAKTSEASIAINGAPAAASSQRSAAARAVATENPSSRVAAVNQLRRPMSSKHLLMWQLSMGTAVDHTGMYKSRLGLIGLQLLEEDEKRRLFEVDNASICILIDGAHCPSQGAEARLLESLSSLSSPGFAPSKQ
mmetsp:Transcript_70033/g.130923  ORF Transcript_70033/g.130923 Transcript_70033/m.130923 type:complete len:177 (-) Transcript_70033:68-598(-)